MIAALPMYDWAQERQAIDALWQALRAALQDHGIPAPEGLSRGEPLWDIWQSPDLVLGQTCGLPYRARLHDRVQLIGVIDYALPGAPPGYYYSHMIARTDDPRREIADFDGAMLALNGFDSQSGWAAAAEVAGRAGLRFRDFHHSGAHVDSARAVANGTAGLAAIDAVTWRLIERHCGAIARRLRVVTSSPPTPGLPLIAARGQNAPTLRRAVQAGLASAPEICAHLGIAGFVDIPSQSYLAVPTPPVPNQGAPVL